MFERWDTSDVAIFAIGSARRQLLEFIDVFGMRFTGLIDGSGVYSTYRVPHAEAPYPQDYIVDRDGIVRYWSDQFDAQEVIATIDRLLGTGIEHRPASPRFRSRLNLELAPNPARGSMLVQARGVEGTALVEVCDPAGRVIETVGDVGSAPFVWNADVPVGIYLLRLRDGNRTVARPVAVVR